LELIGELCPKRRRIWRRLCVPASRHTIQRRSELVQLDLVRVELRRVDARMAHQAPQRANVSTALTHEAICESVP
jgi:hypothetical protein